MPRNIKRKTAKDRLARAVWKIKCWCQQDFLARRAASLEARDRLEALRKVHSDLNIREYVADEYLILYSVTPGFVDLLAIRNHRQLSFDFADLWI